MPPTPTENPRRRNARLPMNVLPAEGRRGRAPAWPLPAKLPAEAKLWAEMWKKPQAIVWERQCIERVVARYVRMVVRSESDIEAPITLLAAVASLEDRLMLNPISLKRAYYVIAGDDTVKADGTPAGPGPAKARGKARKRARPAAVDLRVVG